MTRSGRSGTGNGLYRRNRALLLSITDVCGICGHGGARTADHRIDAKHWPRNPDGSLAKGFNAVENLQPAHGTMGGRQPDNPCLVCGRLCNQVKGAGRVVSRHSRNW